MKTVEDLIEEAKVRFVWWAICIFAICYFLSHTSKSMWMNIPVSLLIAFGLRVLMNEVEFHRKIPPIQKQTYLAYLAKKQLPVNDPRLSTATPPQKWKKKIDSPVVQAAVQDFIDLIVRDFVADLWYSDITPDKEAPELMRTVILDALGEVAGRVKEVNIVDLLTRDMINLVGDHIELYRRNQAAIGVDVMGTLSSEERDERLKHHLMASKELHPALLSPEHEYKFLQQLMSGILALVLRQIEAQCPLVRTIARELLTCLVIQPVIKLASPSSINELIEFIIINFDEVLNLNMVRTEASDQLSKSSKVGPVSVGTVYHGQSSSGGRGGSHNLKNDLTLEKSVKWREETAETSDDISSDALNGGSINLKGADWARVLDAATQRRTEVLAPENLENMWARGRNYKDKANKTSIKSQTKRGLAKSSLCTSDFEKLMSLNKPDSKGIDDHVHGAPTSVLSNQSESSKTVEFQFFQNIEHEPSLREGLLTKNVNNDDINTGGNNARFKKSISSSILNVELDKRRLSPSGSRGVFISEFYNPDHGKLSPQKMSKGESNPVIHGETSQGPKLRCRVLGAYFEKLGSRSFAVYSIAVTDSEKNTWFVNRRYRNFEKLHRQLKDIPNYNLHLPPKRIFSSSTEDAFVHQRCIQLDKYLQDLLSIANVAEQHEVWDFLNDSSKTYSYGKLAYGMRTLAVNVDDAVDDILRQLEGASDGLTCKIMESPSASYQEAFQSEPQISMSWDPDDNKGHDSAQSSFTQTQSSSDDDEEEVVKDLVERVSSVRAQEWHSDDELSSKDLRPTLAKKMRESRSFKYDKTFTCEPISKQKEKSGAGTSPSRFAHVVGPDTVPPEWTPPNVCVPALNLVDKVFQLNRRGWLRRQAFWMSKQILQLVMEDAIDDFLIEQINWLRKDDVIAQGIQYLQNILWPGGRFFLNIELTPRKSLVNHHADSRLSPSGSFEAQLAAARRASDVKKLLFKGAPTALVSFVGHKQYKRVARDIYYFTQSSICIKQLAYAGVELAIISVFPEMKDVVVDIHRKMRTHPA